MAQGQDKLFEMEPSQENVQESSVHGLTDEALAAMKQVVLEAYENSAKLLMEIGLEEERRYGPDVQSI